MGDAKSGEAGHRSQCLSHAKRALYHLSYIPITVGSRKTLLVLSPQNTYINRAMNLIIVVRATMHAKSKVSFSAYLRTVTAIIGNVLNSARKRVCHVNINSILPRACSVTVSYKPPMLVTRVRLPACAYF